MRNRWSATYVCFYLGAWLGRLSAGLPQKSHGISFSICVRQCWPRSGVSTAGRQMIAQLSFVVVIPLAGIGPDKRRILQLMAFGSVSHALTLRKRRRFCQGLQPCAHAVSAS